MTITGKVFKGYAEAVIAKHEFGSSKMVGETDNKVMMALLREINFDSSLTCEEQGKRSQEIGAAQNWLLDNGYLRKYEASWETKRRHSYAVTACKDYIGLTAKGWAVANKYLND